MRPFGSDRRRYGPGGTIIAGVIQFTAIGRGHLVLTRLRHGYRVPIQAGRGRRLPGLSIIGRVQQSTTNSRCRHVLTGFTHRDSGKHAGRREWCQRPFLRDDIGHIDVLPDRTVVHHHCLHRRVKGHGIVIPKLFDRGGQHGLPGGTVVVAGVHVTTVLNRREIATILRHCHRVPLQTQRGRCCPRHTVVFGHVNVATF